MKIEKAIEILTESVELTDFTPDPDFIASVKLGIEAMKAIEAYRPHLDCRYLMILPGETKD